MQKIILFIFCFLLFQSGKASHIIGGEMYYDYISSTENSITYKITLMLIHDDDCTNCAGLNKSVYIGIFDQDNKISSNSFKLFKSYESLLSEKKALPVNTTPKCMTNKPSALYTAGLYYLVVTLPKNNNGYTAAFQTCCRINQINNIDYSKGLVGATYYTSLPGQSETGNFLNDNSPRFSTDISIICHHSPFTFDFSATDPDGDELIYEFCSTNNGGATINSENVLPSSPPYGALFYDNKFSASSPLGLQATINSKTGIVRGIAPASGKYIVAVKVSSYRNGKFIAQHYKDFIITVADCDYASASLQSEYSICNSLTTSFTNLNSSPLNETFYWNFGDPASGKENSSNIETPTHTFTKAGNYTITLIVNKDLLCPDTSIALVKVSPGLTADFTYKGTLHTHNKILFFDKSRIQNDKIVKWNWQIQTQDSLLQNSHLQNPDFIFEKEGNYTIHLLVQNSFGCTDSIRKVITVSNPNLKKSEELIQYVYFQNNSYEIDSKYKKQLNKLTQYLQIHPEIKIHINGYTNDLGLEESNVSLSLNRAKAVAKFLIAHGVRSDLIITEGLGEINPTKENTISKGKILNRRAEIQLIKEN